MKQRIVFFGVIMLFYGISCFAQQAKADKKKADAASGYVIPAFSEGIVYSLPRTGINVIVKAKRTNYISGPYSQFAEKYLGVKGIRTADSESWEITAISTTTFALPDPVATFKAMDNASRISHNELGIITGINAALESKLGPIAENCFLAPTSVPSIVFTDLSSEDFFNVKIDGAGNERKEQKSLEEKAQEAAEYLMRLRMKRSYNILNANDVVPEDGKGFEVFITEAQRLEKEYTALFVGKSFTSEHEFVFNYLPSDNNVKNEVLFRFSPEKGVLPKTDISGRPILLELQKDEQIFGVVDNLKKSANPNAGVSGVYYRIPCAAIIKLSDGANTLYNRNISINQYGVVVPMPENLLNGDFSILFNENTGTIKSIISNKE